MPSLDYEKKAELGDIMRLLLNCGFLFSSIITLIISIMAYTHLNAYNASVQDFTNNWSLQPLVDIKTSEGGCPGGYENLIDRYWPGTNSGCDCY